MTHETTIPNGWRISPKRVISLNEPRIIGVVNATPDSFSDGGRFPTEGALVDHALRLVDEGAAMLDVGGESTRPGAARVAPREQIARIVPVIEGIRKVTAVPISVDTTRAAVAIAAIDAGADAVNDVSAGVEDDDILPFVAERGCGIILMHRLLPPGEDRFSHEYERAPHYADVVEEVLGFLLSRSAAAEAAGVSREAIAIDPGLGFGKSVGQNFELIARTAEMVAAGYPLVSGASRKSFLGAIAGIAQPAERVAASTAVSVLHYEAGVRLFRVHDVRAHREALAVAAAARPVRRTIPIHPPV